MWEFSNVRTDILWIWSDLESKFGVLSHSSSLLWMNKGNDCNVWSKLDVVWTTSSKTFSTNTKIQNLLWVTLQNMKILRCLQNSIKFPEFVICSWWNLLTSFYTLNNKMMCRYFKMLLLMKMNMTRTNCSQFQMINASC